MNLASDGHFRDGRERPFPMLDIEASCHEAAARWCASFGVRDAGALDRLETAIVRRLVNRRPESGDNLADLLDRLARDSIAAWFAMLGADAEGRGFDRLRHAFLDANRDADLGEHFLDPEVDRAAMRGVLRAAGIVPTPTIRYREMPRQTL